MSTTVSVLPEIGETAEARATAARVPWYIWCSVLAVTSVMVGIHWDISWHMSIGRDTFWTPPHVAIYLCGVLSGISCGYLILTTTFRKLHASEPSVTVLGFRGPFGAFIAAWGGFAMLTSAPFDNWWHNAYGLDVKILSPPHALLTAGIVCVEFGTLLLILSKIHRAEEPLQKKLWRLYLYVGSAILVLLMVMIYEYTSRVVMHGAVFYRNVCVASLAALVAVARASGRRWAFTWVTGFYTVFWLAMMWILALVPAQPKLGPVYQHVTHLIPMTFPLLLIVPGIALDLVAQRVSVKNRWVEACLLGIVFLFSLAVAQWPFADFLMSPASRNAIFGSHYFAYFQAPDDYEVRNLFYYPELTLFRFWQGMFLAFVSAAVMARLGISLSEWMKKIRR